MIEKDIINDVFKFYSIDSQYKEKCYSCVEEINRNEKLSSSFYNIYKILYEKDFEEVKPLWDIKNIYELFINNINPFVTNVMILLGYNYHKKNMKKYKLDNNQINIHKQRVKECFESDLINRGYTGVRVSQILWATYFIRMRIIEVGSLQFEYENNAIMKIHIPKNSDLSVTKVKESIDKSKIEIEKIYNIDNYKYICNSWLLSNQIYDIIDKNTNISKFHNLFKVSNGEECISDILNFVYGIDKCENYSLLPVNTTLQRNVKEQLLCSKIFYLGLGVLKQEV